MACEKNSTVLRIDSKDEVGDARDDGGKNRKTSTIDKKMLLNSLTPPK